MIEFAAVFGGNGAELLRLQEQYSREIREVASKEPNPIVQEVLFAIAANHKAISDLSEQFSASARQVTNELRRQRQEIIDPMKDVLNDRSHMNAELTGKNAGAADVRSSILSVAWADGAVYCTVARQEN